MSDIDQNLIMEFIDESVDLLGEIPSQFVRLEKNPDDMETIGAIFRTVHSIKGNSAFFGLLKVKKLAHEMETLLDLIRKRKLDPEKKHFDALLRGLDLLTSMFQSLRGGGAEVQDPGLFESAVAQVVSLQKPPTRDNLVTQNLRKAIDGLKALVNSGTAGAAAMAIAEINNLLSSALSAAESPEESSGQSTSDPMAGLPLAEKFKALMAHTDNGELNPAQVSQVMQLFQEMRDQVADEGAAKQLEAMRADASTMSSACGFNSLLAEILTERMAALENAGLLVFRPKDSEATPPAAAATGQATAAAEKHDSHGDDKNAGKSMRVPEAVIDEFLTHVGELITIREMYEYLRRDLEHSVNLPHRMAVEFRRCNDSFANISHELEVSCMSIRKQTVKQLLQKIPRIIRDVAQARGKDIEVILEGEDVSIDKSLLTLIEAPMVHMTRNAADHGIEKPELRESRGKPRQGRVTVKVTDDGEMIHMLVADDGGGLNFEGLRKKGVEMGHFRPDQTPTEAEIINVIFLAGCSTAEEVTDISGRGVGMDVVKKNVESAGGSISVTTKSGKGTDFRLALPKSVTTQIINGFIVEIDSVSYVIPLKNVIECFPPTPDIFTLIYERHEAVSRFGKILPLIRLSEYFHAGRGNRSQHDGIIIIVEHGGRRWSLLVDTIIGIQQVVLKPLRGFDIQDSAFAGGALMGDGKVALILDIENLLGEDALLRQIHSL
ncbi:MAG: hypothetical protein RL095_2009 [Verrucomicrobiota bacterium]|jgi:two-component system chemotaxis sensor kinase CheA